MPDPGNIDDVLNGWPYDPSALSVRIVNASDGREVIQMRIDMGILQLEQEGRPDGSRPHGFETYYDYLVSLVATKGDEFELDEEQCNEVDREFVQFYHRRICWLRLQQYRKAVADANHTLALMDLCKKFSADDQWTVTHEQYRPFVMFHRTQAISLAELEDQHPEAAVEAINEGLDQIRAVFVEYEAEDQYEEDERVLRLHELREALRKEYDVGRTLNERLRDAVESEQYELAAKLRDELMRRQH